MSSGKANRIVTILLVEDNPGDVRLVREALTEGKLPHRLNVVNDGVEAIEYLRRQGKHSKAETPDLILLDLNLPKLDGREVLDDIKNDPELKRIPVVILSTSRADEDVRLTYEGHANCYITKPADFDQFAKIVRAIEDFWLSVVVLPPK